MKKIVIMMTMCFLSRSIFAQWKVETIDDGFDKYKQAWVMTSDKDARLDLIPYKGKVVLAIETPLINYSNTKNNVEISFKIKGEKRTYNVTGYASKSSSMVYFTKKDSNFDDMDLLSSESFLADFKSATALKVKIVYSKLYDTDYKWEEYVFNMTGSTKAYNSIANQKNE